MAIFRESIQPNAYLSRIRNIKLGLKTRTAILNVLEQNPVDAGALAKDAKIRYGVAMHHLRLLETEGVVERKGNRPYVWALTGIGQKRLPNHPLEGH